MHFTLFIDESGDFETHRGEWLISGILFSDSLDNVNLILDKKLATLPAITGVHSIRDFHLTTFRKDFGNLEAVQKAELLFNTISTTSLRFYALSVINLLKHSLSDRENTYRAMLADLLALCDNVIPANQIMSSLDLVVATRTIDGQLQTTSHDLKHLIHTQLPQAFEYDLASLGLIHLLGKNFRIHQDYANNQWGLVCADFLANINYHRNRPNEKKILDHLAHKKIFYSFEAFGDSFERRCRIAERNQDYVLATFRWIMIADQQSNNTKTAYTLEQLTRLLNKIIKSSGSTGASINLEALLERIWMEYGRSHHYKKCFNALSLLEQAIKETAIKCSEFNSTIILFRVRNLKLLAVNHLGNTSLANELIKLQRQNLHVGSDPEFFKLILDFKLIEIDHQVNSLSLQQAFKSAMLYKQSIQLYQEVWQLLDDDNNRDSQFEASRVWIKCEMNYLRLAVLNIVNLDHDTQNQLQENFSKLNALATHPLDKSRVKNNYYLYLVRTHQTKKAFDICISIFFTQERPIAFDLFWGLYVINSYRLEHTYHLDETPRHRLDQYMTNKDLLQSSHPHDLIWREYALFKWLNGNTRLAVKYIKRSKQLFSLEDSPISSSLKKMVMIYEDIFNQKFKGDQNYFYDLSPETLDQLSAHDYLITIRSRSPY